MITSIIIIILGVATAYILYKTVVEPHVLRPMCLVDTAGCIQIGYYSYKNSVLGHMQPEGYWFWFNGESAYVFNPDTTGLSCKDGKDGITYSPAYKVNPVLGVTSSFECIQTIDELKEFYTGKNVRFEYLYHRVPMDTLGVQTKKGKSDKIIKKFDIYDALNLMAQKNIINISNIK